MDTITHTTCRPSNPPLRVMIWAVPRSLSTVLCKCLSFIPGIRLFYEPYLSAWHLGPDRRNHGKSNEDLYERYYDLVQQEMQKLTTESSNALFADTNWFDSESWTFDSVKNQLEASFVDSEVQVVLFKDPAYAIAGNYDKIPQGYRHVFLFRHPLKAIQSFKNMMTQISDYNDSKELSDDKQRREVTLSSNFRYTEIYKLYQFIATNHQANPLLIDADDLQNNPDSILRQLCDDIGVPYQDSFTTWPKSDEFSKEWVTAKANIYGSAVGGENGYFRNAFNSTHFKPAKEAPARESLTKDVLDGADSLMPMYEELYQLRIKPTA